MIRAVGSGVRSFFTVGDKHPDVITPSPAVAPADADADVELAILRNGLRIILAVDELPPAPEGTFYEAWLHAPDGAVVSAGTFHMRNQTGRIELWAGVTPERYPSFLVTLEDDDGDPAPSFDVVFEADVSTLADS